MSEENSNNGSSQIDQDFDFDIETFGLYNDCTDVRKCLSKAVSVWNDFWDSYPKEITKDTLKNNKHLLSSLLSVTSCSLMEDKIYAEEALKKADLFCKDMRHKMVNLFKILIDLYHINSYVVSMKTTVIEPKDIDLDDSYRLSIDKDEFCWQLFIDTGVVMSTIPITNYERTIVFPNVKQQ